MLKSNVDRLVKIAVEGKVAPPLIKSNRVGSDGLLYNVPGVGGITYNVLVGDSVFGWAGDHVEPAVTTVNNAEKRAESLNMTYTTLSCIGNEVIIISGDAKGSKGVVTGTHGGVEHVICDFKSETMEKMAIDDKVQIRSFGQGLELVDYPEVKVMSLDPSLLDKMNIKESNKGELEIGVSAIIPGKLMGSGLGDSNSYSGDYDVMTSDSKLLKEHKLTGIRLGDVVAITDHDASFGWRYLTGACIIGVVVHANCVGSGHGPGVTTIMTSPKGHIKPFIDKEANIGRYLNIGRFR